MKTRPLAWIVFLALAAPVLSSCSTASGHKKVPQQPSVAGLSKNDGKSSVAAETDDLDEYAAAKIADPIEPLNRLTFWINHQLYTFILRPVSKGYETVIPQPLRKGVYNVFDNVRFPVRFVNDALQAKFPRAGQEIGRFVVNSTVGVGGLFRPADKIPALANVPPEDTGQTFAKWGIDHGFYLVLPVIGPSSIRDGVGLAGDYALNPITWVGIFYGCLGWTIPVSVTDTVRILPDRLSTYDAATENSLDRYLAARSAYAQYRDKVVSE